MVTMSPLNTVLDRMVTLSRAMDEALGGEMAEGGNGQVWVPALDAWETEHAFTVQLDLPGVTPESVDLSFDRNVLTVRGTRPSALPPRDKEERRVFFAERAYGTFARSLRFPQFVEADKIEAAYNNGVLTITVPKAEAAKPRKIAITGAVEHKQVNG